MSFFTGKATEKHSSPLPAGATREQGVAMLRDHEFFLQCDPHMVKFSELTEATPAATPPLPDRVRPVAGTKTRVYEVHDLVHNLPDGLWDSNVISTCEITDIEGGIFVRLRSPMSVLMDTFWEIAEVPGGGGGLEMIETITIIASRLLLGIIKSLCEGGWRKIHEKMLDRLRTETGQVQTQAQTQGQGQGQPPPSAPAEVLAQAS